ncbi:hypothetical protein [Thermococcus sp.]
MVKIGQRMIRASIIGNLIGMLLFLVFYMGAVFMNGVGATVVIQPYLAGIFGWVVGLSAALGIELSKDLEPQAQ